MTGAVVELGDVLVRAEPDWLLSRMAAPAQGWHLQGRDGEVWPVLSNLDFAVLHLIRQAASQHLRLAVGVPRVAVGVSLGPVIYAALAALVQQDRQRNAGPPLFPVQTGERLMVASRSHAIRDMLAESSLKFDRLETRLSQFPIFRLGRNGDLVPGVFGRAPRSQQPHRLVKAPTPIVLYDYWPVQDEVKLPTVAAIFAELTEMDHADIVDRLMSLIDRTSARFTLAVVNLNDPEKRRRLEASGFHFVAARTPEDARTPDLSPTFSGIDLTSPKSQQVTFLCVPDDDPPVKPLTEVFQLLAEAHARVEADQPYPLPLQQAWYLADQLIGCPSTLQRYEALRKQDPYTRSLAFRLERLAHANFGAVSGRLRGLLLSRWPALMDLLKTAYDALTQANPKWWAIAEAVLYADAPLGVVLPNRLAAQALREDLLLAFDWTETTSPVTITSLLAARRGGQRFDRILVPAGWSNLQRPLLFSLLPAEVRVIGYPFEAPVLEKRLKVMQADLDVTVSTETGLTFRRLLNGSVQPARKAWPSSLRWDTEAISTARVRAKRHWMRSPVPDAGDAEDEVIYERASRRTQDGGAPPLTDDADELVSAITLTFADGGSLTVPEQRELLVLPKGQSSTEQRFAQDIHMGDQVLLLTSDEHADIFTTALARTAHLTPVDPRIAGRWHAALVTLRARFHQGEHGAGARFCQALEALGCARDRVTMRGWLRGTTMAPRDESDVGLVLTLSGETGDVAAWAALIHREMNSVRDFHRRIGRRIARRMAGHAQTRDHTDRIDDEIDELLDLTHMRTVVHVSQVEQRAKSALGSEDGEDLG